jgi:hypothetical protein
MKLSLLLFEMDRRVPAAGWLLRSPDETPERPVH